MKKSLVVKAVVSLIFVSSVAFATPSTQIWNPSTDIQAAGTFHLGIDNYFSIESNASKSYAFGTDLGLTYGLSPNIELGFDVVDPTAYPLYFNAKVALPEANGLPAFAAGIFNVGLQAGATDYNIIYGVTAKTIDPIGRFSLGYYTGNSALVSPDAGGFILSWDKAVSDKVWLSVDYATGNNFYGCLSFGGSYLFAPNTSIIFGYVIFNNSTLNLNNVFTTQLDINF